MILALNDDNFYRIECITELVPSYVRVRISKPSSAQRPTEATKPSRTL